LKHSSYLGTLLLDQSTAVAKAIETLGDVQDEFDAFVCTGVSGMLLAPTLAFCMGKRLAVVRKRDDKDNHAMCRIEHNLLEGDRWLFVDDLIASADTIQRVIEKMDYELDTCWEVGRYLYMHNEIIMRRW
jgi:adenine/guanine phosphoribosyltransferase-like PRPP-binding protein